MNADQEPRNPSGPSGPSDGSDGTRDHFGTRPDEVELSDRLTAIADRHVPVPDWADLVHRAGSPPSIPLQRVGAGSGGGRRPFGRSTLAVAAALIVVIGAVGTFVATRGGDDESVDSGPAGPEDVELIDTGWYIPTPLPNGWEVTSIETSDMNLVGPVTLTVWTAADETASLTYVSEPSDDNMPMVGTAIQLSAEIGGTVLADDATGYPGAIAWHHDDLFHLVIGNGLDVDAVKHAARQMAGDPGRTTSPVDGLQLVDHSVRTYEERAVADVTVGLRTPGGRTLYYQLSPADGMGRSSLVGAIPVVRQFDGQPLEVLHLTARPGLTSATTDYLGIWPGADVTLPLASYSDAMDGTVEHPTDDEVAALLRSLRPATAEQWRAFVKGTGLEVDERLLEAEQLEDLSADPDSVDDAGDVQSTTTDPEDAGATISSNEIFEPWPEEALALFDWGTDRQSLGNYGGQDTATAGTPFPLGLNYTALGDQRLDVHECTALGTSIGLVPADSRRKLPRPDISGCDPTRLLLSIEPGQTVDWPVPQLYADGVPTREIRSSPTGSYLGGTLNPGEYRMVASLAMRSGINGFGMPVTITAHPCGGFTSEFVDRMIFTSLDAAEAAAEAEDMTLRVVELDGVEQAVTEDLQCDRVNVSVDDGTVVAVEGVG